MTRLLLLALLLPLASLSAQARLPLKLAPRPTTAAITAEDLMSRLYAFADDSMMGREAGTEGSVKATDFITRELQRLGLRPAGDGGSWFQAVPLVRRATSEATRVAIEGDSLAMWSDYAPVRAGKLGAPAVFSGTLRDSTAWISAEAARGKVVVFEASGGSIRVPPSDSGARFAGAAALAIIIPDPMMAPYAAFLRGGAVTMRREQSASGPAVLLLSRSAATRLFGYIAAARPGAAGKTVNGEIVITETELPARNVVAILPGSDAKLRGQYVALGAHSDHVGYAAQAVDHDSLRAFDTVLRPQGMDSPPRPATPDDLARVRAILDSLRALNAPRADSINNGADDDGSGSMALLEIAEAMAKGKARPKRSVLFVWHTAEEKGLFGSEWFTDHPTVPRDSIVAQLNIDMIGRGSAADVPDGGPGYLQLIGSRRLSTELGDLVEKVNAEGKHGFTFDYQYDANGHPEQYYCRSDHYEYARYGIPVVFFSTGGHRDYHLVTDEPQYIDYVHYRAVTQLIHDIALRIADLDHRVVVDKPKPDPKGVCVQ
ncbi:MAG TPA: M28 family peptidase [Gemmatimonadaceae bacterium]|nr:M28 family peptidase [Gemmatimonadaceae bacterium]